MNFFIRNYILSAFLLSIGVSVVIFMQIPCVNLDGIWQYFPSSDAFITHGFRSAFRAYHWPLYPILIAIVSKLLHINFLYAAYVLNTLLLGLLVIGFVKLVEELTSDRRVILLSIPVILSIHTLNMLRDQVIRDFGYWVFLLFAAIYLIRLARSHRFRDGLWWMFFILLASLFRVEGFFILCSAPFLLFVVSSGTIKVKIKQLLKACWFSLLLGIGIVVWISLNPDQHLQQSGRLADFINQIHVMNLLLASMHQKISVLLAFYGLQKARAILVFGLLFYFVWQIIEAVGIIYIPFIIHGVWLRSFNVDRMAKKMIIGFAILAIVPPVLFYWQGWDMTRRYFIPAFLFLYVWIPFSLIFIYAAWKNAHFRKSVFQPDKINDEEFRLKQTKWFASTWFLMLVFSLFFVEGFTSIVHLFGPSKTYIVRTGWWVKNNISPQSKFYSNSLEVSYYGDRLNTHEQFDKLLISEREKFMNQWFFYDYAAIRVNKNNSDVAEYQLLKTHHLEPIKIFHNRRGDVVVIYQFANGLVDVNF